MLAFTIMPCLSQIELHTVTIILFPPHFSYDYFTSDLYYMPKKLRPCVVQSHMSQEDDPELLHGL